MKRCVIFQFGFVACIIAAIALFEVGCDLHLNEFKEQEEKIKPMVRDHAPKNTIIATFGTNFVEYSKGQTNWENLALYLRREPSNAHMNLRERAERWPHVLFYSTPDMMTWIFLDQEEKVVDFVVGAQ